MWFLGPQRVRRGNRKAVGEEGGGRDFAQTKPAFLQEPAAGIHARRRDPVEVIVAIHSNRNRSNGLKWLKSYITLTIARVNLRLSLCAACKRNNRAPAAFSLTQTAF